jgi:hypothetical protein
MRVVLAVSIAASWSFACATTQPAQTAPATEQTAKSSQPPTLDIQAMLAREVEPLAKKSVAFPGGAFTAEVEGAGEPAVAQGEGFVRVDVPIGTQGKLNCFLYPQNIDTAATLHRVISAVPQNLEVQQIRPTSVTPVGVDPLVFVEAAYEANSPQGKLVGLLKAAVFAAPEHALMCMHDELGYVKSFQRIVTSLAGSLKPK